MSYTNSLMGEIDEQGRLILPPEIVEQYGLEPGALVRIEPDQNRLRIHRSVTQLAKIYIEPTTRCNLKCTFCIRNGWEEKLGRMSEKTFDSILASLKRLQPPLPTVFFGGLGEPLAHPKTVSWIKAVKQLGCRVELITNGTALIEKRSRELISAGLDLLWVSIDGASPESYADVRLGAALPEVVSNVIRFRQLRAPAHQPTPEIGIAFVALQRNIADLPAVIKLGRRLGARHFSVSNVMPYSEELQAERLYTRTIKDITYLDSPWLPKLNLPKMDLNATTWEPFFRALKSGCNVTFAGNRLSGANDVCNFIESGSMSIAWDGNVSPCWPLMHTHTSYLHGKQHHTRRHIVGNVHEHTLEEIWRDPAYLEYRSKVQGFAFAPCTYCGGCDLSEANEEDCLGNKFPACGSCLWSQGMIQCP